MTHRDGHIRVLPIHVANKIAAGEVVERPASIVKELVENSIDAGSKNIKVAATQGGRKLVAVQDDGCGMSRDDALLSLERQATSKILDVDDIESIDTLGFRGEAIPSIASVSRFTITTRRADSDEGTLVQVNAGHLADVRSAGCPPGTLIEARDLFCNVPARRKFLRSYLTEENHIRRVFTVHALAHPSIGFTLSLDGREIYRLAPASRLLDRIVDLFGSDFASVLVPIEGEASGKGSSVRATGFMERPNLNHPTRREQYVFVNGRPATAACIAAAIRDTYPMRHSDVRPALILFLDMAPTLVDVNVHPTKREVRFRDNAAVRDAVTVAIETALRNLAAPPAPIEDNTEKTQALPQSGQARVQPLPGLPQSGQARIQPLPASPPPAPLQVEFAIDPNSTSSRPWQWFKYLAQTDEGFILLETDSGIVTLNPRAARERIAYERLLKSAGENIKSQTLLIPVTVRLSPAESSRIKASLEAMTNMGFSIEEFGRDTFKIDAVPTILGNIAMETILPTIAGDLAEPGVKRNSARWREELIAKSVAKSFAGSALAITAKDAVKLVEALCACKMPYVSAIGKPIMIFTSNRELYRKFAID